MSNGMSDGQKVEQELARAGVAAIHKQSRIRKLWTKMLGLQFREPDIDDAGQTISAEKVQAMENTIVAERNKLIEEGQ